MQKYYNDFYVITAPPNLIPGPTVNFDIREIDTIGYNSITIINLSFGFVRVPAAGGITLNYNEKLEILGNKNEVFGGIITINLFRSNTTRSVLIIRKKYI
jgi:hypothetical protein